MKKIIAIMLITICVNIIVCGDAQNESIPLSTEVNDNDIEPKSTEYGEDMESVGKAIEEIEVEKELFNVEITIPEEFVGDLTQEDIGAKETIVNKDGSVTFRMSKSQHKALMKKMSDNINNSFNEWIESEDYSFTDIKVNEDFSNYEIKASNTELNFNEQMSFLTFAYCTKMYKAFEGKPVTEFKVSIKNEQTGESLMDYDINDAVDTE